MVYFCHELKLNVLERHSAKVYNARSGIIRYDENMKYLKP